MKLTAEEIAFLAQFDKDTRSAFPAARANYLRSVGRENIDKMKAIYERITGVEFHEQASTCSSCELHLQQILCAWYDEDKATAAAPKKAARKK